MVFPLQESVCLCGIGPCTAGQCTDVKACWWHGIPPFCGGRYGYNVSRETLSGGDEHVRLPDGRVPVWVHRHHPVAHGELRPHGTTRDWDNGKAVSYVFPEEIALLDGTEAPPCGEI
jgi:hypothetical protein